MSVDGQSSSSISFKHLDTEQWEQSGSTVEALQRKDDKIKELKKKLRKLEEEVQHYAFEEAALESLPSFPASQGSQNCSSEEMLRLEQKIEEQNHEISELTKSLSEVNLRSVGSERNVVDKGITSRLDKMVGKCKHLEESLEKSKVEAEDYRQKCDELQTKLRELEGEAIKCRKCKEELRSKEEEWKTEEKQMESMVAQKVEELHRLKEDMEIMRNQFHSQMQVLLKEKEKETEEKDHYKSEVSRLTQEKKKMELDVQKICSGFQKEAEKALLSYMELKEKYDKNSIELEKLRKYRSEFIVLKHDSQHEKKVFEAEREKFMAMNNQLQDEIKSKNKSVKSLEDEVMTKSICAETYKEDFEKESKVKNELGRRIRTLEKDLQKEKEANESLCAKMQAIAAKNESLTKTNGDLTEQLNSMAATQCLDTFSDAQ